MKLLCLNAYGSNFGDLLGVEIAERLYQQKVRSCDLWHCRRSGRAGVLGLGSILHYAISGDVVWGTGINPVWQRRRECRSLDIRAVRGPLTRAHIQDRWGLPVPEIYGDPAQLARIVFPLKRWNPVRKFGAIPHHHDLGAAKGDHVMLPIRNWNAVLDFILGCELVISSSLHGIIIAEAFGIPARWWRSPQLPSTKTEDAFKYNDYYACTDRSQNDWSESVSAAIAVGGKEPVTNYDPGPLRAAFPSDKLERARPLADVIGQATGRLFGQP